MQLQQLSQQVLYWITKLVNQLAHNNSIDLIAPLELFINVLACQVVQAAALELPQQFGQVHVLLNPLLLNLRDILPPLPRLHHKLRQRGVKINVEAVLFFLQGEYILHLLLDLVEVSSQILLLFGDVFEQVFLLSLLLPLVLNAIDFILNCSGNRLQVLLMETHQILDLLHLLVLLAQLFQEDPAIDLLLQLVHVAFVVVDNASLVEQVVRDVEQAVHVEGCLVRHYVVETRHILRLPRLRIKKRLLALRDPHTLHRRPRRPHKPRNGPAAAVLHEGVGGTGSHFF